VRRQTLTANWGLGSSALLLVSGGVGWVSDGEAEDGGWGALWDEVTLLALSISYIIATQFQTIWGALEISGDANVKRCSSRLTSRSSRY
jgi:hypothetical protein